MANCPGCGGALKFDIASQKCSCSFCGGSYDPAVLDSAQQASEYTDNDMGVTVFSCPNCGGEVYSTDRDMTGICSFCGAPVIFESRMSNEKRPALIIPFKKTKEECKEAYLKQLGNAWFAPKALKDPAYIDGFRGIYMPYWIENISHTGKIRYYASKTDTDDFVNTFDIERVNADVDMNYNGLMHDASSTFSDDISMRVEPFNVKEGPVPFHPAYLSGFYAEPANVSADEYETYFDTLASEYTESFLYTENNKNNFTILDADVRAFYDSMPELNREAEDKALRELREKIRLNSEKTGREAKEAEKAEKAEEKLRDEANKKFNEEINAFKSRRSDERIEAEKKGEKPAEDHKYVYENKNSEARLALLPVWFLSYKNGDRVAYAAINGQTGRVSADIPIDKTRFFATAGVIFIILFAACMFFTLTPVALAAYSVWFTAMVIFLFSAELKVILSHANPEAVENSRDDKAVAGVKYALITLCVVAVVSVLISTAVEFDNDFEFIRGPFAMKIYAIVGLIAAAFGGMGSGECYEAIPDAEKPFNAMRILIPAVLLLTIAVIIKPASDLIFYAAISVGLIGTIIAMMTMITSFNRSAMRPLPQFALHKGGDDRA